MKMKMRNEDMKMPNAKKKDENVVDLFPVPAGATDMTVPDALANALVQAGNAADAGSKVFLKFTKLGEWCFGRDEDEVDEEEELAVNPMSFTVGWQGWNDGSPVEGPTLPINRAAELPQESELDPIPEGKNNGWIKQFGVSLKSMSDGTVLQFNTSSRGGKQAITRLMKAVGLGLSAHPEAPVALVRLGGDSYKHDTYGRINTPEFKVVGWANGQGEEVKNLAPED